jgi:hypothetical protein
MSLEKYILEWIAKVSKMRPELGGFAICPFAKTSKYKIIECSVRNISPEDGYDVIIFSVEMILTLDEINDWVRIYNQKYPEWKFFEDCASRSTYINGIKTNNGKYNLILGQPKQKLKKHREILAKTNYYNYWDNKYLKEILEDDYNIIEGIETP